MLEMAAGAAGWASAAAKPAPFIVYAMPRSRTTWLSKFLGGQHDAIGTHDTLQDIAGALTSGRVPGIVETGLTFAARAMYRLVPNARVLVVRRHPTEVAKSLGRNRWQMPAGYYEQQAISLDRAGKIPGALTVAYDELATEDGCRRVYEHCTGKPCDAEWLAKWMGTIVDGDLRAGVAIGTNRRPFVSAMRDEADEIMSVPDVRNETWDEFFPDAQEVFKEHYAEAGPIERLDYDPDFDIAAKASKLGMLQITTARTKKGQLVGYLLCQVEHHVEDRKVLRGIQIPFFIRKPWRGPLALKMHRFMRQSLAARGVKLLTVRSGVRAAGPRQDALFKYLGAKPDGQMFMLPIGEA